MLCQDVCEGNFYREVRTYAHCSWQSLYFKVQSLSDAEVTIEHSDGYAATYPKHLLCNRDRTFEEATEEEWMIERMSRGRPAC